MLSFLWQKMKQYCQRRYNFIKVYFSSYFSLHLVKNLNKQIFLIFFFSFFLSFFFFFFFSVLYCNGCSFFSCSSSIYLTSFSDVSCSIFFVSLLVSSSCTTFLYFCGFCFFIIVFYCLYSSFFIYYCKFS